MYRIYDMIYYHTHTVVQYKVILNFFLRNETLYIIDRQNNTQTEIDLPFD